MKMIKRTLALLVVLSLLCVASACAEDIYWDSTTRIPNLYNDNKLTFNNYFSISVPDTWEALEVSDNDAANGILYVMYDNQENPKMKLTVSIYTPDECTSAFGGTGYDAIYAYLGQKCTDLSSVKINDIWTMLYSMNDGEKNIVVMNTTTSDGYMFQCRFDVWSVTMIDVLNNILKSADTAK